MSQDNTITLSVDADGTGAGAAADVDWSNFDRLQNRSIYNSESHTPILRDNMTLYRTMPKPTSTFYGVTKGSVKFSKDVVVDTPDGETDRAPIILQLSGSVPVGATAADVQYVEECIVAFIRNRTAAVKLFEQGEC